MQNQNNTVAVGYNGNQLTQTQTTQPFALSIDYLILNLSGSLDLDFESILLNHDDINPYRLELQEFGTKVFKNRYQVFYKNEPFGWLMSVPHSKALNENLAQLQIENHLFYTKPLQQLHDIIKDFCNYTSYQFQSINRLDIALDLENQNGFYQNLMQRILTNQLIVSGKDKKINPYYQTEKGKPQLTGFTIGSRTASRYLRVYSKTQELLKKPKDYILQTWNENHLNVNNVWRFEYQLNNSFFRFLSRTLNDSKNNILVSERLTWGIFDYKTLFELLQIAEKNHFEIKYNTGKSQINKEKTFVVINWEYLRNIVGKAHTQIKRIKKIIQPSFLSVKRMAKAVFREYYQSQQQSLSHVLSLNNLLHDYSDTLFSLKNWFYQKLPMYVTEFEKKQTTNFSFDYTEFKQHLQLAL